MASDFLNQEFLQKLRATFSVEAEEHLDAVSSSMLELERVRDVRNSETLESAFRHVHSLKGAARAVNLYQIETLCQALETLFVEWRSCGSQPARSSFDVIHAAVDAVAKAVPDPQGNVTEVDNQQIASLLAHIESTIRDARQASVPVLKEDVLAAADEDPGAVDTGPIQEEQNLHRDVDDLPVDGHHHAAVDRGSVRVPTSKLATILTQTEELLSVKLGCYNRYLELNELTKFMHRWKNEWGKFQSRHGSLLSKEKTALGAGREASQDHITVSHATCDDQPLPAVISDFLYWNSAFISELYEKLACVTSTASRDAQTAAKLVDELLRASKQLLMLPISTIVDVLPKVVRDLSREKNKLIDVVISGSEMEVDKRILEELKDPIMHLVRNAVDHGIEIPETRLQFNKPERGTITIKAEHSGSNAVEITVSDDGAGIDIIDLKNEAIQRGVVSSEEAADLSDRDAASLIFHPGLSTSVTVTEISGRGMGLAIVQQAVQKLGGRVEFETGVHRGTTFRITAPLIVGTVNGLLISAAHQHYIIPTSQIKRVATIHKHEIKMIQERQWMILDQKVVPFLDLGSLLWPQKTHRPRQQDKITVVLVTNGTDLAGFAIEEVLSVHEVMVKPLSKPLLRIKYVLGVSTLESGKIVPILRVDDLLREAKQVKGAPGYFEEKPVEPAAIIARGRRVLLAEDSITSRMLLKGILEGAGFKVDTAVDGVDAITRLRTEDYDLLVSDIEMPRMNGFDLTAEIRRDRKLTDLPVVLVTALSSSEDRERGIDVGANAYIVKTNFEQSNLLEAVRRLI